MLNAVCLGGATLDVLVSVDADAQELPGQKQEVGNIALAAGGGAMNAASVLDRLGAQINIHCAIGRDEAGAFILGKLKEKHVATTDIEVFDHTPTGKSVITIPPSGNATVMAARGANRMLSAHSISKNTADLLYVTSAPKEACSAVAERLSDRSRPFRFVAFNPGMSQIIDEFALCARIVAACDLLMLNEREALQLAQEMNLKCAGLPVSDICRLLGQGLGGFVCVTAGTQGAWLIGKGEIFHQPSFEPFTRADRHSTIGAGDTFGATLAYMLTMQRSPDVALRLAAVNAASTVSRLDANSGALSIEELHNLAMPR